MYKGALMPPSPFRPMNSPWPIHSGHGGPMVEIERPSPIINEPTITVQRVPTLSAIRDMMMPPMPEPSHASALASAGTERAPPTSAAMSLSATAVIQAAPNDIPRMASATEATVQEALVSTEPEGNCSIGGEIRLADPFTGRTRFHHPCPCGVCSTCCIALKCASLESSLQQRSPQDDRRSRISPEPARAEWGCHRENGTVLRNAPFWLCFKRSKGFALFWAY